MSAVTIDTKIDPTGAEKGAKELEAVLKRLGDTGSDALDKFQKSQEKAFAGIEAQKAKVEGLRKTLDSLREQAKSESGSTQWGVAVEALEQELERLNAQKEKLLHKGASEEDVSKLTTQINTLTASLQQAREKIREVNETGVGTSVEKDIAKTTEQLATQMSRLDAMQSRLAQKGASFAALKELAADAEVSNQRIAETSNRLNELKAHLEELKASGLSFGYTDFDQITQEIARLEDEIKKYKESLGGTEEKTSGFKNAISKLKDVAGKAWSGFSKLARHVPILGRAFRGAKGGADSFGKSLKGGLKNVLKYAFGIRSLFILVRKIKEAVKEGLNNLVQVDPQTNSSISGLVNALTQLKNALATAFAPILNVVAPYITTFINLMSKAATAVGMFFAKLTGQKTFKKAVGVNDDYAKSLKSAGSAASGAAKKQQKYLSGLDEIAQWQEDNSSSGGGGGGGGSTGTSASDMFETVEIPSEFDGFADKVKEAWAKADFTEIGTIVGTKLKDALDKIPWDGIQNTCRKIAKSTVTFLNGVFETPGLWDSVGTTVGEAINTVVYTIKDALDYFHWDSLGAGISIGLQTAFRTVDWGAVFGGLASFGRAILDFISGAILGIDWRQLPKDLIHALKQAFTGIDWNKSFYSIGKLIAAALLAGIDFVKGLYDIVSNFFANIKDFFTEKIDEKKAELGDSGWAVAQGILSGIGEVFADIGRWIKENILDPFIQAFKDVFGIHSPASNPELLKNARYVGEGILNGIANAFKNVKSWVKNNIITPIQTGLKRAGGVVVEIGNELKNSAQELWSGFKQKWGAAREHIVEVWNDLKNSAQDRWNNFKTQWGNASAHVVQIWNELKNSAQDRWNNFKNQWGDASSKVVQIANNLKNSASSLFSSFSANWNSGTKNVGIGNYLKNSASTLFSGFSSSWGFRNVSINNQLTTSANSLFSNLSRQWGTRYLDVKASVQSQISPKNLFTNEQVSFAFKNGSKKVGNLIMTRMARGGIINSATLFPGGVLAGEAGKEAIIPLERNTGWIDNVAGRITDLLANPTFRTFSAIADAISNLSDTIADFGDNPIPVMATGKVTPPSASVATVSGDIGDKLDRIFAAMQTDNKGGTYVFSAQLDRRTLFDEMIEEAKLRRQRTGLNPLEV